MKRWLVFVLCLCMVTATACAKTDTSTVKSNTDLDTVSDSFGEGLAGQEGFVSVASNGNLELFINPQTTEIAVKNISSDYIWYSNPQNSTDHKEQITLTYCDQSNNMSGMNSYDDSVAEGQFAFQKIDNGVRVVYEIGKKVKVYAIPQVISATTFKEKILSKLSEEDAETVLMRYDLYSMNDERLTEEEKQELKKTYKRFEKEDIYVRAESLPEFALKRLETTIVPTGYSLQDLAEDNEYHGLTAPEVSNVFVVALEYRLDETSLSVTVPVDSIQSPSDLTLTNLQLMRWFGAADATADGYMLVPDGSGAIINLNSNKGNLNPYVLGVYGENMGDDGRIYATMCHLPIFALKNGDNSYLTVIESGEASASIQAQVLSDTNPYNNIFASFEIRRGEKLSTNYSTGLGSDTTDLYVFQKDPLSEDISVRYMFQSGDNSTYVGMATAYREYLIENQVFAETKDAKEYSMTLDILGAVEYPDSLFGIPVTRSKALTTYAQAEQILTSLYDKGVDNVDVRLLGWANEGIEGSSMKKLSAIGSLGGKRELENLIETSNSLSWQLYPDVDIQFIYNNKVFDGYTNLLDSPKNILGESWLRTRKSITTHTEDTSHFVVRPTLYSDYTESISKKLKKLGFSGVSTSELGYTLYADYSKKHTTDRSAATNLVSESVLNFAAAGFKTAVERGNIYTIKNAALITDLPLNSSGVYYLDEDVPFYPIVLHGYVSYSGEALNMAADSTYSFLRALEYGAALHYTWMFEQNNALREIDTNYYGVCWEGSFEKAVENYAQAAELLKQVTDATIVNHQRISDDVYCTTYSNGITIFVNYGTQGYDVNGVYVSPQGCAMQKEAVK